MEPKLHNDTDSEFSVAVAASYDHPLPLERPKEVFPTETKATAKPARYKPLPFDAERVFSQDPTLCMHWLNLPLMDGLLFVTQVYQQIKAMVDQYQLEHVDAFYEQYSDLLQAVLSDEEKNNPASLTTSHLRMKHKVYDKRLAHLLWHYYNAMYMYEGSLANLCILANVNGPGKFKDFGVACKVSYINTRSNRYEAFPKPVGSENYVTNYTKFAAGKTFNGSTFVSIPQWITDIYGNRGQHSFNLSDCGAAFSPTGDIVYPFDTNGNDYDNMSELVNNMYTTIHMFGTDVSRGSKKTHFGRISNLLDPSNKYTAIPSTPYIENGAALSFETSNDSKAGRRSTLFKLNLSGSAFESGFSQVKDGEGNDVRTDNIISRAWDTFLFWATYAEEYFSAFAQPTSQVHELFQKLGYIEKSKSNVQFFGLINTDSVFDALDLRRDMIYKNNNKANTATIVKWMPILDTGDTESNAMKESGFFKRNFDRYPVDNDDLFDVIKASEKYPSLTPTIFHEVVKDDTGKAMPYVINTIGSASTLTDDSDDYPAAAILGRYASLFDLACSSSIDPSSSVVDTIAIDPEKARDFIKRNDSIILKERPTTPRVFTQPLIDSTDIYQCGFNVIIASNSKTSNEFELWFKDRFNYYSGVGSDIEVPGYQPAGTKDSDRYYTHSPVFGVVNESDSDYLIENRVVNEAYLKFVKHAIIFVGDAVFVGPQLAALKLGAGTYAEHVYQKNGGTFISNIAGLVSNMESDPTTDIPDDELLLGNAIIKSVAIAACYNDPGYLIPGLKSEYETFKADFPLICAPEDNPSGLEFRQYTFSPDYGIVKPILYDTPDCGLLPTMGYEGNHKVTEGRDLAVSLGPKQYVSNALNSVDISSQAKEKGLDFRAEQIKINQDYDSRSTAGQFLLWFVDKFQFKRLYTIGKQIYTREDVARAQAFSSPAKTFLSLLQRGIVFWNGIEDTISTYNIPDERKRLDNPSWGSVGGIDFGGFIRLPVVKNKTLNTRNLDMAKSSPNQLRTEQSESLKGNPSSTNDSRRKNVRPNGKRLNKFKTSKGYNRGEKKTRESEFDVSDKSLDQKIASEQGTVSNKLMKEATSVL